MEPTLLALHGARGSGKDTTFTFLKEWCEDGILPDLVAVRRGFADKMKLAYMRMWVPDCTQEWAIDFIEQWKNDNEAVATGIFIESDGSVMYDSSERADKLHTEFKWDGDEVLTFIPPVNFRDHMNQFATESARFVYGDNHWVDMLLPRQDERHVEGWRESFMIPPRSEADWPYSFADFCVITDLRADNEVERIKEIPDSLTVKIKRRDAEEKQRRYYEERGEEPHLFSQELPDDMFDVIINNDDNSMEMARIRTNQLAYEIAKNGAASIRRGGQWRI